MVYIFCFLCWTYRILFFVGRCFSPSDTCSSSSYSWFGWFDLMAVQCIVGIAALQITLDFLSSARCSLPACSFQPLVQTICIVSRPARNSNHYDYELNCTRRQLYCIWYTHTYTHTHIHREKWMLGVTQSLCFWSMAFYFMFCESTARRGAMKIPHSSCICFSAKCVYCAVLCCTVLCWCLSHRNCIPNCNILWAFSTITDLYECV